MYIWLIYDREGLKRNAEYVSLFRTNCQKYRLDVVVVLDDEVKRRVRMGECPLCSFVRTINPEINRFLEEQRIPVFNSYEVSRICNHKGKTLEYLREQVLCVPSITLNREQVSHILNMSAAEIHAYFRRNFSFTTFSTQELAMLEHADDFVVKTVDGHGGAEVFSLAREREQIKGLNPERQVVLQPMIASGENSRDMRVYVIGSRIVAAVMRSSEHDFRANFSRGGTVQLYELTEEQEEVVRRVIHAFHFGMVGIDFILDDRGSLILNEIEDVAGARMLYECAPDIDIVKEYLTYVLEQL